MVAKTHMNQKPRHIAVVMDGNGRWAKARHRPRIMGHHKGVEATRRIVELSARNDVECLTLFAFSSENWKRPEDEVKGLMSLFIRALDSEAKRLLKNDIRLQLIGGREAFPEELQHRIAEAEELTKNGQRMRLLIAANYGGRWDIVEAANRLMQQRNNHSKSSADTLKTQDVMPITAQDLSSALSTQSLPDPDLFIRTGGERRISNFLLWQLAYTELYFTDVLWPDFDEPEFDKALEFFAARQRRFGKTGDQVKRSENA